MRVVGYVRIVRVVGIVLVVGNVRSVRNVGRMRLRRGYEFELLSEFAKLLKNK